MLGNVKPSLVSNARGTYESLACSEREAMKYVESLSSSFNHDEGGGGVPQFRSRFAERVWRVAMDQVEPLTSQQQQSDMFVPGRSLYKWDLGFEVETGAYIGSYDLPLTITRSRAETKTFDHEQRGATDSSLAETSALVLEKVSRIFETHRMVAKSQGAKSAASRKAAAAKVAMPPPPSLPPPPKLKSSIPATISTASGDSDDDDIFGDAGTDYIVARSSSSISSSSNPYFNNKEMDLDAMGEKKPGPPINDVSSLLKDTVGMLDSLQGAGSASKIIEKKQEVVVESATSIDSDVVPQRLERLQPMQDPLNDFQGLGQQGDDSGGEDEEADFEQIDVGVKARKKRQLTRADFQDDDSFHEYKNNQVALPKAAFRFGIKGSDKKATGFNRTKNKEKGKRKLEREFEQLDNVMAKKYGRSLKE